MRALLAIAFQSLSENTPFKIISAASTNAAVLASPPVAPGQPEVRLTSLSLSNVGATPAWVQLYDQDTVPDPLTDVPVQTYIIPGRVEGAGSNLPFPPKGILFGNGLSIRIVGDEADTTITAVAAGQVVVNYTLGT